MKREPEKRLPARAGGAKLSETPPAETFAETDYLKRLVQDKTPIVVHLRNNEEVAGILEYYDTNFIRLTRKQVPNLFIFKHEIKYLSEQPDTLS
jgi:sRNA-binding regulator protein Hfq